MSDDGGDVFATADSAPRDIGFRLWDVKERRQPPLPPKPAKPEEAIEKDLR
jgi:hypothetical protein